MDEDELVHGLVNSLAFEVEAIPQDNVIKFTSTNGTPLNVKVRVRNKDEPRLVQRGIVSVPKLGKHIAGLDQIKIISSDQTILSFNVYMETELKKPSPPKSRRHGFNFFKFGGCLGTEYDEDEGPYLPGPSGKKAPRSRTSNKSDSDIHNENINVNEKRTLNLKTSTGDKKRLFGKCKPGGCLDPPFGEDKEPYRPGNAQARVKPKQTNKVKDSEEGQSTSSDVVPGKSSKESTKLFKKKPNKDVMEPKPLLDIYARPVSLEHSSTSNYSNAAIRKPSKMPSNKIVEASQKSSKTYDDDSLRQSYQYPQTYFIPPKDIFQHKEEERRYSRERSNDQIRPATTSRLNDEQTTVMPHIFDEPNKNYPENAHIKSSQPIKLSKHKGKDNTERIKQTLTDLACNGIDNAQKASEDYRKNSKTPSYVLLVTQRNSLTPGDKETWSLDVTDPKNLDDFEIPIAPDDLDLSVISQGDPRGAKKAETKKTSQNSLEEVPISIKLDEQENKNLFKDIRNKNIFKNDEPIRSTLISEALDSSKPESVKVEDLYVSPTLVSGMDEVKTLQSVSSSNTQESTQVSYILSDSNSTLKDKPTKTSNKNKNATSSESNKTDDQTNLPMVVRLPSLENILGVVDTYEKNNNMPDSRLKDNSENENSGVNIYPDSVNYVDTIQKTPRLEIAQEKTNESQKPKYDKLMNENSNFLVSEVDEEKVNKSPKAGEIPNKQIKGNQNVHEEQIENSETSNKLESDEREKLSNHLNVIENSTIETLQDMELKITNNEQFNNLICVESQNTLFQNKFDYLNSKGTPNNDPDAKKSNTDFITNQNLMQYTVPSKTLQNSILDEQYQKTKQNETTDTVVFIRDSISSNKLIANSPDFKDVTLDDNDKDKAVKTSNYVEKFGKQLQENKNIQGNISDIQATNVENAFGSEDEIFSKFTKTVENSLSNHQIIDISDKNSETNPAQKISHNTILNADKEYKKSSTNSIESSNNLKNNILFYEESKKASENDNLKDNDNVIIKNTSLHDRDNTLNINTQDRTPSAILQKTPLARTDDSDLLNDNINVIKPFKRNTFTIVASNYSLEKQEETTVSSHTDLVTDEYLDAKNDEKWASSDITHLERYTQNDQQSNNGTETILMDNFLNTSAHSKTSLVLHDRPRASRNKSENKNEFSGIDNQLVPGNHIPVNTEVTLDRENYYEDVNNTVDKYLSASKIASKDVDIEDSETYKNQENNENDSKEKLINNLPTDLAKHISKLQDISDDNFENIDLGPNLEIAPQINKDLTNDDLNDEFNNTPVDYNTTQISNSQLPDNSDDLLTKKISISNIPINSKGAEEFVTEKLARDVNDIPHVEAVSIMNDIKSETNSASNSMEYGSRLLEISEGNLNHELRKLKHIPEDSMSLTADNTSVPDEPDEHTFKLFFEDSPVKEDTKNIELDEQRIHTQEDIRSLAGFNTSVLGEPDEHTFQRYFEDSPVKVDNKNENLDTHFIHTHDQEAINDNEDSYLKEKADSSTVESFSKLIDKSSLVPEDSSMTGSNIDEGTNLRNILEAGAMRSFNKIDKKPLLGPKDDSGYDGEYDGDTKSGKYSNLQRLSESASIGSMNENSDKTPIVSEGNTRDHDDYDNTSQIHENASFRKTSKPDSVGTSSEVTDKELLSTKSVTRDIEQDVIKMYNDGKLVKSSDSDAVGSFREVSDEIPPALEDGNKYKSDYGSPLKAPISTDELGNIHQSESKTHIDTTTGKQPRKENDSVVLKQQDKIIIKPYNKVENIPTRADPEGTISNSIQKTKSEVLFLNLALQSYVNDNNETVVQTLSPLVEPLRHADDYVTVVQSLIRQGHEIRIPVDVEHDLSLKFTSKTQKVPQNVNSDHNSSKKIRITKNVSEHGRRHPEDVDESLAFIYERELIPLHNIIKNLTEEINTLTTQQELLKDKMRGAKRTKSLRLIPVSKRCGCGRM